MERLKRCLFLAGHGKSPGRTDSCLTTRLTGFNLLPCWMPYFFLFFTLPFHLFTNFSVCFQPRWKTLNRVARSRTRAFLCIATSSSPSPVNPDTWQALCFYSLSPFVFETEPMTFISLVLVRIANWFLPQPIPILFHQLIYFSPGFLYFTTGRLFFHNSF